MMLSTLLLIVGALVTLACGFESWRLTSSKKLRVYTMIGSPAMGYAAYLSAHAETVQKAAFVAFIVAMLFGGYAIGFFMRCKNEPELLKPAWLTAAVAAVNLLGAVVTYLRA